VITTGYTILFLNSLRNRLESLPSKYLIDIELENIGFFLTIVSEVQVVVSIISYLLEVYK